MAVYESTQELIGRTLQPEEFSSPMLGRLFRMLKAKAAVMMKAVAAAKNNRERIIDF